MILGRISHASKLIYDILKGRVREEARLLRRVSRRRRKREARRLARGTRGQEGRPWEERLPARRPSWGCYTLKSCFLLIPFFVIPILISCSVPVNAFSRHFALDSRVITARRRSMTVVTIITRRRATNRPRDMTAITSTTRDTATKAVTLRPTSGRSQITVNETRFFCLIVGVRAFLISSRMEASWRLLFRVALNSASWSN